MNPVRLIASSLLFYSLFLTSASAETISGIVNEITDGDTITVFDENARKYKIRLFAVDAPETSCHLPTPTVADTVCIESAQRAGKESKDNLVRWIFGKKVYVLINGKDKYNRYVGTVYLGKRDINLQQVKEGYAWIFTRYAETMNPTLYKDYVASEESARAKRIGLWKYDNPMPPWEYRRK